MTDNDSVLQFKRVTVGGNRYNYTPFLGEPLLNLNDFTLKVGYNDITGGLDILPNRHWMGTHNGKRMSIWNTKAIVNNSGYGVNQYSTNNYRTYPLGYAVDDLFEVVGSGSQLSNTSFDNGIVKQTLENKLPVLDGDGTNWGITLSGGTPYWTFDTDTFIASADDIANCNENNKTFYNKSFVSVTDDTDTTLTTNKIYVLQFKMKSSSSSGGLYVKYGSGSTFQRIGPFAYDGTDPVDGRYVEVFFNGTNNPNDHVYFYALPDVGYDYKADMIDAYITDIKPFTGEISDISVKQVLTVRTHALMVDCDASGLYENKLNFRRIRATDIEDLVISTAPFDKASQKYNTLVDMSGTDSTGWYPNCHFQIRMDEIAGNYTSAQITGYRFSELLFKNKYIADATTDVSPYFEYIDGNWVPVPFAGIGFGRDTTSGILVAKKTNGTKVLLSGITHLVDTATATSLSAHSLNPGDTVTVYGTTGVDSQYYNGTFTIDSTPTTTSFTYTMVGIPEDDAKIQQRPINRFNFYVSGYGSVKSEIGFYTKNYDSDNQSATPNVAINKDGTIDVYGSVDVGNTVSDYSGNSQYLLNGSVVVSGLMTTGTISRRLAALKTTAPTIYNVGYNINNIFNWAGYDNVADSINTYASNTYGMYINNISNFVDASGPGSFNVDYFKTGSAFDGNTAGITIGNIDGYGNTYFLKAGNIGCGVDSSSFRTAGYPVSHDATDSDWYKQTRNVIGLSIDKIYGTNSNYGVYINTIDSSSTSVGVGRGIAESAGIKIENIYSHAIDNGGSSTGLYFDKIYGDIATGIFINDISGTSKDEASLLYTYGIRLDGVSSERNLNTVYGIKTSYIKGYNAYGYHVSNIYYDCTSTIGTSLIAGIGVSDMSGKYGYTVGSYISDLEGPKNIGSLIRRIGCINNDDISSYSVKILLTNDDYMSGVYEYDAARSLNWDTTGYNYQNYGLYINDDAGVNYFGTGIIHKSANIQFTPNNLYLGRLGTANGKSILLTNVGDECIYFPNSTYNYDTFKDAIRSCKSVINLDNLNTNYDSGIYLYKLPEGSYDGQQITLMYGDKSGANRNIDDVTCYNVSLLTLVNDNVNDDLSPNLRFSVDATFNTVGERDTYKWVHWADSSSNSTQWSIKENYDLTGWGNGAIEEYSGTYGSNRYSVQTRHLIQFPDNSSLTPIQTDNNYITPGQKYLVMIAIDTSSISNLGLTNTNCGPFCVMLGKQLNMTYYNYIAEKNNINNYSTLIYGNNGNFANSGYYWTVNNYLTEDGNPFANFGRTAWIWPADVTACAVTNLVNGKNCKILWDVITATPSTLDSSGYVANETDTTGNIYSQACRIIGSKNSQGAAFKIPIHKIQVIRFDSNPRVGNIITGYAKSLYESNAYPHDEDTEDNFKRIHRYDCATLTWVPTINKQRFDLSNVYSSDSTSMISGLMHKYTDFNITTKRGNWVLTERK